MNVSSFVRQVFIDFESLKTKISTTEYQYCETILQTLLSPSYSKKSLINHDIHSIYQFIARNGKDKYSSYYEYHCFVNSVKKMSRYWFENEKRNVHFSSSLNPICFLFFVRVCCVHHFLL